MHRAHHNGPLLSFLPYAFTAYSFKQVKSTVIFHKNRPVHARFVGTCGPRRQKSGERTADAAFVRNALSEKPSLKSPVDKEKPG